MRRVLPLALTLLLLCASAFAEPLALAPSLAGEVCLPEGTDAASAAYVYRYDYPQVAGDGDVEKLINAYFAYLVTDAENFAIPMAYDSMEAGDVQNYTTIRGDVTCNSDDYFSVRLTTEDFQGAEAAQIVAGYTFARTGAKAGSGVMLPHVLGILAMDEGDEWVKERATAKADALVWDLVWSIIEEQKAAGDIAYDPDLTRESLEAFFFPDEDFYLNESGDVVFFIQPSFAASAADGVLLFPFSLFELQDEL